MVHISQPFLFVTFQTNWLNAVVHNCHHNDTVCLGVSGSFPRLFLTTTSTHWRSPDQLVSGSGGREAPSLSSAHTTSRIQNKPRPSSSAPLSVDQLCLCVLTCSMGVRVMDTSWVSRRGTRKCSSTPPCVHPPTPPIDAPLVEQPGEFSASPSLTPPPSSSDRAR